MQTMALQVNRFIVLEAVIYEAFYLSLYLSLKKDEISVLPYEIIASATSNIWQHVKLIVSRGIYQQ
jgi:hypothetical protein